MENINLLILEDEYIIFTHIAQTLKKIGFTNVFIAKTYYEALELASKHQFHIMFSDIKIEGEIDGIDTARVLQNMFNNLAVVFITAYNDEATLARASKVDFFGYLLKPYREDELKTLISLILKKYRFTESSLLKISGKYIFDMDEMCLYREAKKVKLSTKEEKFFQLVFNNLGAIVPYSIIDEVIWIDSVVSDSTRRTFIYRIKQNFPDLELETIQSIGIKVR